VKEIHIKSRTRAINVGIGHENGKPENDDHPGTVRQRIDGTAQKNLFQISRRCMTDFQILGQIKIRQGCNNVAENKKGEKGQEDHGQEVVRQQITDHLDGLKIDKNPGGEKKHEGPKGEPHNPHKKGSFSRPPRGAQKSVFEPENSWAK
jgi:hypothetical protein